MHRSQHFNSPIKRYPADVKINDRVYFEAKFGSNDSDITGFIERCSASTTTNKNDPSSYMLIQNRLEIHTIIFQGNTSSNGKKFCNRLRLVALNHVIKGVVSREMLERFLSRVLC